MRRTRLSELLDIELPVLDAPMGPEIARLELAAAVSNADLETGRSGPCKRTLTSDFR